MATPSTSLATTPMHDRGFKYTFVKLDFKPSFVLSNNGPQGEDALKAWETTLHDMYFLGGGDHDFSKYFSTTFWGRIVGTQNQVMIVTGRQGRGITSPITLITSDGTPDVLSPLKPFLLLPPKIINVGFELELGHLPFAFAADLNLCQMPATDPEEKSAVIKSLDQASWNRFCYTTPHCQTFSRGRLYSPEGLARSFTADDNMDWLRDRETYVHLMIWSNREPTGEHNGLRSQNLGTGTEARKDWSNTKIGNPFTSAESLGVIREEYRVDFKQWHELLPEYLRVEYMAKYPGCVPTRPLHGHGQDCEHCAPWVDKLNVFENPYVMFLEDLA